MKRIGLLMLFWGLVGVGLAKDWPQMRNEADKGLPPWIQYYNRLKGEPRLGGRWGHFPYFGRERASSAYRRFDLEHPGGRLEK